MAFVACFVTVPPTSSNLSSVAFWVLIRAWAASLKPFSSSASRKNRLEIVATMLMQTPNALARKAKPALERNLVNRSAGCSCETTTRRLIVDRATTMPMKVAANPIVT